MMGLTFLNYCPLVYFDFLFCACETVVAWIVLARCYRGTGGHKKTARHSMDHGGVSDR